MKYLFSSIFALALLALVSCSKESGTVEDNECAATFVVTNYQQYRLLSTGSSDAQALSHLWLALYSVDGSRYTLVDEVHATSDEDAYNQISFTLSPGRYAVLAVGCNNSSDLLLDDPRCVSFSDGFVHDFLYCFQTMELTGSTTTPLLLERAVAAITIITEDDCPESLESVTIQCDGGTSQFDAVTGMGTGKTAHTTVLDDVSAARGTCTAFISYTFLPVALGRSCQVQYRVSAQGDDAWDASAFETSVELQASQRVTYTVDLFAESPGGVDEVEDPSTGDDPSGESGESGGSDDPSGDSGSGDDPSDDGGNSGTVTDPRDDNPYLPIIDGRVSNIVGD